jgi:Zn-dependent protease
LVHADALTRLAAEADRAVAAGDAGTALANWREALDLLPADSRQHRAVADRVAALSRDVDAAGGAAKPHPPKPAWVARAGALAAIGLLLWKLKFVLGVALTKGKLLLLGLTKAGTLFSMILSLGVYWAAWGWKFAAGLIATMYVHEMGHVAALQRLGIKAGAPMFVPGLGAFVRLKQYPADPRENARVGLAGPIWGLGATLACYAVSLATGWAAWAAIARVSAWLNLLNLLPVWQLDGGRGFHALSRVQRWIAAGVIGAMLLLTSEGLLVLLLIAAAAQAWFGHAAADGDRRALLEYVVLVIALAALATIKVPPQALTGLPASLGLTFT